MADFPEISSQNGSQNPCVSLKLRDDKSSTCHGARHMDSDSPMGVGARPGSHSRPLERRPPHIFIALKMRPSCRKVRKTWTPQKLYIVVGERVSEKLRLGARKNWQFSKNTENIEKFQKISNLLHFWNFSENVAQESNIPKCDAVGRVL